MKHNRNHIKNESASFNAPKKVQRKKGKYEDFITKLMGRIFLTKKTFFGLEEQKIVVIVTPSLKIANILRLSTASAACADCLEGLRLKARFIQRCLLKQIAKCAVVICEAISELRGICRLHIHLPPFNGRPIKLLLRGQRRLKRAAFQNTAAMRRKKHPLGWKMRIANARA